MLDSKGLPHGGARRPRMPQHRGRAQAARRRHLPARSQPVAARAQPQDAERVCVRLGAPAAGGPALRPRGVHLISLCPARQLWARLAPRDEDAETSRAAGGLSCGTFVTVVCARPRSVRESCEVPRAARASQWPRGVRTRKTHTYTQQTVQTAFQHQLNTRKSQQYFKPLTELSTHVCGVKSSINLARCHRLCVSGCGKWRKVHFGVMI
mmetsp:Transcript_11976/g.35402  ORF Transcript_11976/g.35402 Transcript_11976/m.35402 type:complete len:209 (-) Transcript_11976:6-632(-)